VYNIKRLLHTHLTLSTTITATVATIATVATSAFIACGAAMMLLARLVTVLLRFLLVCGGRGVSGRGASSRRCGLCSLCCCCGEDTGEQHHEKKHHGKSAGETHFLRFGLLDLKASVEERCELLTENLENLIFFNLKNKKGETPNRPKPWKMAKVPLF
jgi:hypothetical protein